MNRYEHIRDFEERLRDEHRREFAEEQKLADELFDLYLEADEITCKQWNFRPERRETLELVNRIFNDLHAGWKLIMEGMLGQGMTLLRDTIECANYIKLLEVDMEFRDEWRRGEKIFLRDVRERLKKQGITPPPQDHLYKNLSQIYAHPSKKGTAWHVIDWWPTAQEHGVLFNYGGVKDIPRTRIMAVAALALVYLSLYFIWQEMFPIDKDTQPVWYRRFAAAAKRIGSLHEKANQEWMGFLGEQLSVRKKILDDYFDSVLAPFFTAKREKDA